jgi:hypothetical protein
MQRSAQPSGIAGVDVSITGADSGVDHDGPSYDRHNPIVQLSFEQVSAL